jgi:hypothetical protein
MFNSTRSIRVLEKANRHMLHCCGVARASGQCSATWASGRAGPAIPQHGAARGAGHVARRVGVGTGVGHLPAGAVLSERGRLPALPARDTHMMELDRWRGGGVAGRRVVTTLTHLGMPRGAGRAAR